MLRRKRIKVIKPWIHVIVTKDRRIKIADKYYKYDRNEDGRNGEDGPTATWMTTRLPWSKDCP